MKIKLAIVLFISSIASLQAVEAAQMNCPTLEEIKQSERYDATTKKYTFHANSTGAKVISFTGDNYRGILKDIAYTTIADHTEKVLVCRYLAKTTGHGWSDILLLADERDAVASCKANKRGDYFECE